MKGKNQSFTSAAIALTVVIFVIYSSYSALKLNDKMDAVQSRIETVNFSSRMLKKTSTTELTLPALELFEL